MSLGIYAIVNLISASMYDVCTTTQIKALFECGEEILCVFFFKNVDLNQDNCGFSYKLLRASVSKQLAMKAISGSCIKGTKPSSGAQKKSLSVAIFSSIYKYSEST